MRSTRSPSWIDRLLGLDPVAAPPHVFALDAHCLRYGSFHRGSNGAVFETSRELPIEPEWTVAGPLGAPLPNPPAIAETVRALVADLSTPVKEASLVLPDSWLRLIFTEVSELPRGARARDEVVRWKLKRLVPLRVEDLRLVTALVRPFPEQDEPGRLLIGFGLEMLLEQLEQAFRGAAIELGRITNVTLALWAGLDHLIVPDRLTALVSVQDEAFTLSYRYLDELLLYRYKAFGDDERYEGSTVRRDLRLTESFLRQKFPEVALHRIFVSAPLEREGEWLDWLSAELEVAPEPLAFEHFPLVRNASGGDWLTHAPLLGAACLEVA